MRRTLIIYRICYTYMFVPGPSYGIPKIQRPCQTPSSTPTPPENHLLRSHIPKGSCVLDLSSKNLGIEPAMMQKSSFFGAAALGNVLRIGASRVARGSVRSVHHSNNMQGPEGAARLDASATTRPSVAASPGGKHADGNGWNVRALRKTSHGVEVLWDNEERSLFHFEWLYRNRPDVFFTCGQNMQRPTDRLKDVSSISAALGADGETLRMRWNDSSPESSFKLVWLRQCSYSDSWLSKLETARAPVAVKSRKSPEISVVDYDAVMNSDEGVKLWMEHVNRDGLCLLRGVPLVSGTVTRVAERIGPVMATIYGSEFDVQAVIPASAHTRCSAARA